MKLSGAGRLPRWLRWPSRFLWQDRPAKLISYLTRALAVDPTPSPVRLANLVAQRRARWLMGRSTS